MVNKETMKAFARAFAAEKLLAEFFADEVERTAGPEMSDAALRWREGRRALASEILRAVESVKKGTH